MDYIKRIHYLVGPNGTGKTRALIRLKDEYNGIYIPKQRLILSHDAKQYADTSTFQYIQDLKGHLALNSEQVAMSLLRERSKLRFTIFSILSEKLGRVFSIDIIEKYQRFVVSSGLSKDLYKEVTIQRYDLIGESSGLKELLVLLTLIHSEASKTIFIDEPEISLHPEAQRFLKNEIIKLAKEQEIEFWLATHSPIFFAPETIEELSQATFFSNPQKPEGTKPNFYALSQPQITHLEKSLLRLDSEKWLLVHSKAVIFCEGFRDKVIFKKVLERADIDISGRDLSLIETGGKDDFSTLYLLCGVINKPCYFIGDLDNLIDSKVMDKYNDNEFIKAEIATYATNIQEYISEKIRKPLGDIYNEILSLTDAQLEQDTKAIINSNLARIKDRNNNSKSLVLEIIVKHTEYIKSIFNIKYHPKLDLIKNATDNAVRLLAKAGFLIISSGSLETLYKEKPLSPNDDKEKIRLFDSEWLAIKTDNVADISNRYKQVIDFITAITVNNFDKKKLIKSEVTKFLAKISVILLENKPLTKELLIHNEKYDFLKISDLFNFESLSWSADNFDLKGESAAGFVPKFKFHISSLKGINDENNITFE